MSASLKCDANTVETVTQEKEMLTVSCASGFRDRSVDGWRVLPTHLGISSWGVPEVPNIIELEATVNAKYYTKFHVHRLVFERHSTLPV